MSSGCEHYKRKVMLVQPRICTLGEKVVGTAKRGSNATEYCCRRLPQPESLLCGFPGVDHVMAPCCNKIYTCRFCHNAKENHELNRHAVLQVICMVCKEKQRARMSCSRCGTKFGQYFCLRCRFYDDEDKGQFHCEGCGICRVGGRENYSHCSTCNMCFNIQISDTHKCVVNSGKDNCGLCLEPIHTSILKLKVPQCGHIIHEQCSNQLIENNIKKCPTCRADFLFM